MKKFDLELEALQKTLVKMGERAEQIVELATQALKTNSGDIEKEVYKAEDKLDQMQIQIDQEVVRLLTVYTCL